MIGALKLASEADKVFKGSNLEEKRKLINLGFSNLQLKGQRIVYTLCPPFDVFVKTAKNGEWCALVYDFITQTETKIAINQHFCNE